MSTVEQRLPWQTSSYSGNTGNCVEVAGLNGSHFIRDTKDRDGGTLTVSNTAWSALMSSIKNNRFAD
ncbi:MULTISPECIES: DUF397 domain-containing protein [unclassified Actinopolyspora]|uniref:DUF397 domain-containing protein n=1 Tax=unclassified Actinopolyspora TaxID=2639451 RepID=UPI0013F6929A|nr:MULTISPECIES: DUF397 domain-containing protein [unclassified Actinopolyspora]NHD16294.1 DUF397 domain-containing protein [Actinopolyspora sp. BKK2]NHE75843.1 DUF397 domain-containing protein [Actinopolyspora sp. BKK1]